MHTNTRAKSTIFVLLVVTATSLLIISSNTMAGLAARSDLSHNSGKRHEQSKTNDIGSVSDNNNTQSAIDNTPSATSNNENPSLDTLLACESGAANGSGHITMSEVMNCYLQFSRGSASSLSILGDNQNSDRTVSGSGSGSASDHHFGSTKMNLSSHHQGSANHVSHGEIPAPTD